MYHPTILCKNKAKEKTSFWHRTVLVLVGFAAAFLVQIFPRPISATRHASGAISRVVASQTNFYTDIISGWLNVHNPDSHSHFRSPDEWEKSVTGMYEVITAISPRIMMIKYELSSSPFTSKNLGAIHMSLARIQESLNVMASTIPKLNERLRRKLEKQTGFLETRTIADVMSVFTACTAALKTGEPLPQVLPTPLLARVRNMRSRISAEEVLSVEMIKSDTVCYNFPICHNCSY